MARHTVTDNDKIQFNELYLQCGTYAEIARRTGFSASTVKKYIIPNYVSINAVAENIVPFDKEIFTIDQISFPNNRKEFYNLLVLTDTEKQECEKLREELLI